MEQKKRPAVFKYYMNIISLLGMFMSAVCALIIVLVLALQAFRGFENPYLEIVTYFLLPGGILFGGVLTYLGAWRVRSRHRRHPEVELPPLPRLDFNDPQKLRLTAFFALVTVVFFAVIGVATIKGFEFTESTQFCGELCHPPMEPEYTAWQKSPHARVRCVECHVGSGIKYYALAKINGTKQLYSILTGTYPTPIETPVENLRPARGTCERCHWPEKFFSARQKIFYHNAPNEQNSPREINYLIKIGGTPGAPNTSGIHWHIGKDVTYVQRDHKRQDLPYVAVKEKDGSITEYFDTEKPMLKEEVAKKEKRLMDCIDCHNRPAHVYNPPGQALDHQFAAGKLDKSLPFLKKVALAALTKGYKTEEEAVETIEKEIQGFYAKNYPAIAGSKAESVKQAVEVTRAIYKRNFFPKMKLDWSVYPNNLGHMYSLGCFRCHDGKHKAANGKVISKDCKLCHTLVAQIQENIPAGQTPKDFVHPADIGDELYRMNCSECHAAGGQDVASGAKEQHH